MFVEVKPPPDSTEEDFRRSLQSLRMMKLCATLLSVGSLLGVMFYLRA
jgi:hypothetical protein